MKLLSPENNNTINLNNAEISEYTFSWENANIQGYTLILSNNKDLKNEETQKTIFIKAGNKTSMKFNREDMDWYLSQLSISAEEQSVVYWSVKQTTNEIIAIQDIRSLNVTRITEGLKEPENKTELALDMDNPDTKLTFSWNTKQQPQDSQYEVRFYADKNMTGTPYTVDAGDKASIDISHNQLQTAIENLSSNIFEKRDLYWTVFNKKNNSNIASPRALNTRPMMRFTDVRGNESITYKVVEIYILGQGSQIWLAENLKAKKYPDGTDIENSNVKQAPAGLSGLPAGYEEVYGNYYHYEIKDKIAPAGWRLPTFTEVEDMYKQSGIDYFSYNAVKDPIYYSKGIKTAEGNINKFGLSLVAAGRMDYEENSTNTKFLYYNQQYCYLLATGDTDPSKCANHDGGGTIWHSPSIFTPARLIYVGK